MERLRPALEAYNLNTLQVIAETLGVELPNPVRKQRLVSDLYREIPVIVGSADFLRTLNQAEREVLKQMIELNRVCNPGDVIIPLVMRGIVHIPELESTAGNPTIHNVLQSLLRKGLIVNLAQLAHAGDRRQFEPLYHFAIPHEVQVKLTVLLEPVDEIKLLDEIADTVIPASVHSGNPEEFIRQLFFTWSELHRKSVRLLKSGSMGKRDQRRIANSLGWTDDESLPRMQLLVAILRALNLIYFGDDQISAADNNAVTLFWNTSSVDQMREIFNAYQQLGISLVSDKKALTTLSYYGGLETRSPSEMRKMLADVFKYLTIASGVPYPLYFALATGGMPGHLALSPASHQILTSNLRWFGASRAAELQEHLYALEHQIVISALHEMRTLGFIDIGYGQDDDLQPKRIQISGLLRAYLTQQPWSEPREQGQVILQPDAQLLAMGPVPLRVLSNLERVAVREKQDQSVITYRVTRDGAYQALQRGETLTEIRGYLEDATGQPLPQNIARSLEEWAELHERIVVRRDVQILQVALPEVLEKLFLDSISSRLLHRLDEKTAWVKTTDAAALEKRLLFLEALPARSYGHEIDLENSLRWNGELLISRSPLPSIYVIGTMRLIAESIGNDESQASWAITSESVKCAVANGLSITDILKLIENMTGMVLSPQWNKKIKAWGEYYGESYTAQVRIIRLENSQILRELRTTDQDLNKWLTPLPQSEGLAVVKDIHWNQTLSLLDMYGIPVREKVWW